MLLIAYKAAKQERREFFESYAKENHFDPLVASNWYSSYDKILFAKVRYQLTL